MSNEDSLQILDSLFDKIDQKRESIPASLANLKLTTNNRQIPIIGSDMEIKMQKPQPQLPLLGLKHLDASVQERLKQTNIKKSSEIGSLSYKTVECGFLKSENRFSDLKKKLLTKKICSLTSTLKTIQLNYFEKEHEAFFETLCTCMDQLHLFV